MAKVEYLDPEIAGEGEAAEDWQPFVAAPAIPTYKGIKSILKYFPQFSGIPYKHKAFPTWLYHRSRPSVLARTAEVAKNYGVTWRDATHEEKSRGFPAQIWDYAEGCEWRTIPFSTKFNPLNPDTGKEVKLSPDKGPSQSEMISAVVAAVMAQMGGVAKGNALATGNPAADPEYQKFLEFKKLQAVPATVETPPVALAPSEERELLVEAANSRGIKLDGRWSIDRIKQELDKVA